MKTASILDMPIVNELDFDVDVVGQAVREFAERVNYDLVHGRRVVISSNPFSPEFQYPVTVLEPKP